MKPARWIVMVLTLYLALDVVDPSIPGIFFFDSEQLFVDTVVDSKAHHAVAETYDRSTAEPVYRLAPPAPAPAPVDRAGHARPQLRTDRRDLRGDPARSADSAPSDAH